MKNILLISVDELWLRKKNRPAYVQIIFEHIRKVMDIHWPSAWTLRNDHMRLILEAEQEINKVTIDALLKIPGLHSITPAIRTGLDPEEIFVTCLKAWDELKLERSQKNFRVDTHRSDKKYPINSMQMDCMIGERVLLHDSESKVDLHHASVRIKIRITEQNSFVSVESFKGLGGLPWGSSGHGLCLLSGGIDSPVASWLMLRRGLKLSFVFFHAYPYVGDEVKEKIYALMRLLAPYQKDALLTIFPFGEIQAAISKECLELDREQYRTLIFRRLMIEAANLLAKKIDALVLVTGDSLGQVSSQTIHNISYLDRATILPIFRPLIGLNKSEIVDYAKQIGTYETSLIPHDDACALFAPKHPIIKPDWNFWETFDNRQDLQALLENGLENAQHWHWMPDGRSKIVN